MVDPKAVAQTVSAVVGAAKAIIDAEKAAVEFAARSCVIEIDNMTAETLELTGQRNDSGGFGQGPPHRIAPFANAVLSAHSTALGQGAVGALGFTGRDMVLEMFYSNPFAGSNSFEAHAGGVRVKEFIVDASAGSGNTGAFFRCAISHPVQDNWHFCGKCHGLFWLGGNLGDQKCPAGDFHQPAGVEFVLTNSIPEGPRMQHQWQFCTKCHGMFWTGPDVRDHHCPAGGLHNPMGLDFVLPFDLGETPILQSNWRFCRKCHGMFWDGPDVKDHHCPGGDPHDPAGFIFCLPHKP
jgi:hypothetical protein